MAVANLLPTEIVQSILSFTNPDTYFSARLACSTWLHAASTAYMLRKALDHAPFPLPPIHLMTEDDWNNIFNQVAHLHLLGKRDHIVKTITRRNFPSECSPSTSFELSSDGKKMVVLKGSRVNVYDMKENGTFEFAFGRSLYPLWSTVFRTLAEGGVGFFAISERYAKYHLAMSRAGDVIAIGLGKSIQIYDLNDKGNLTPVQHVLGSTVAVFSTPPSQGYVETDGVIKSLEFTEDDTLLRVEIENDSNAHRPTRVRYLGDPAQARQTTFGSKLDYWKANHNRVFLDSAALAASFLERDNKTAFRGLRLLSSTFSCRTHTDNSEPGRFFAAALKTSEVHGYCIGFVPHSDQRNVTIKRLFPTRLPQSDNDNNSTLVNGGSTPYQPNWNRQSMPLAAKDASVVSHNLELAKDRWDPINLPSATTPVPVLSVSDDGKLLVVYESGAGHSYKFASGGALYVYSLENWTPVQYEHSQQQRQQQSSKDALNGSSTIQPWSFLLDITNVDVDHLRVTRDAAEKCQRDPFTGVARVGYTITATTAYDILNWHLV